MARQHKLDRTDVRILAILQAEARITNAELAGRVHLSPSSCLQRVRKLERAGILDSYHARIDLQQVCRSVTVIAEIQLSSHDMADSRRFEETVAAMPEAIECLKVSGTFDYIVRFVCPDMAQYHALSESLLESTPGIAHLASHVVLARCKESDGFPLASLLQPPMEDS